VDVDEQGLNLQQPTMTFATEWDELMLAESGACHQSETEHCAERDVAPPDVELGE
jgi:hypothetical protein